TCRTPKCMPADHRPIAYLLDLAGRVVATGPIGPRVGQIAAVDRIEVVFDGTDFVVAVSYYPVGATWPVSTLTWVDPADLGAAATTTLDDVSGSGDDQLVARSGGAYLFFTAKAGGVHVVNAARDGIVSVDTVSPSGVLQGVASSPDGLGLAIVTT